MYTLYYLYHYPTLDRPSGLHNNILVKNKNPISKTMSHHYTKHCKILITVKLCIKSINMFKRSFLHYQKQNNFWKPIIPTTKELPNIFIICQTTRLSGLNNSNPFLVLNKCRERLFINQIVKSNFLLKV